MNMEMFDQQYLDRAFQMTKTGKQFFWEPNNYWHFAAHRGGKLERYTKTIFTVTPVFKETQIEIWPVRFNVTNARFKSPHPNMIMLYHGDMCVWTKPVQRPANEDTVVKVNLSGLIEKAIIAINGMDPELVTELQRNWSAKHRVDL